MNRPAIILHPHSKPTRFTKDPWSASYIWDSGYSVKDPIVYEGRDGLIADLEDNWPFPSEEEFSP